MRTTAFEDALDGFAVLRTENGHGFPFDNEGDEWWNARMDALEAELLASSPTCIADVDAGLAFVAREINREAGRVDLALSVLEQCRAFLRRSA